MPGADTAELREVWQLAQRSQEALHVLKVRHVTILWICVAFRQQQHVLF